MKAYKDETKQVLRFNYLKISVFGSVVLIVILNKYNVTDLSLWILFFPLWLPLVSNLIADYLRPYLNPRR